MARYKATVYTKTDGIRTKDCEISNSGMVILNLKENNCLLSVLDQETNEFVKYEDIKPYLTLQERTFHEVIKDVKFLEIMYLDGAPERQLMEASMFFPTDQFPDELIAWYDFTEGNLYPTDLSQKGLSIIEKHPLSDETLTLDTIGLGKTYLDCIPNQSLAGGMRVKFNTELTGNVYTLVIPAYLDYKGGSGQYKGLFSQDNTEDHYYKYFYGTGTEGVTRLAGKKGYYEEPTLDRDYDPHELDKIWGFYVFTLGHGTSQYPVVMRCNGKEYFNYQNSDIDYSSTPLGSWKEMNLGCSIKNGVYDSRLVADCKISEILILEGDLANDQRFTQMVDKYYKVKYPNFNWQ